MAVKTVDLNQHYYDILYGALLHDIGKFFWRADKTQPETYSNLTENDIGRSGAHSKWSADFFNKYIKDNIFELVNNDIIENLILYHHNPDSDKVNVSSISHSNFKKLARIIQIADHASSGERIKRDSDEEYGSTRTELLHSIFSSVKLNKNFSKEGYYKLVPLSLEKSMRDAIFPFESKQEAYGVYASDTQPLYKNLFNGFITELQAIIKANKKITFTTLSNILLKYMINIPSATYVDIPDISLFHHVKSTAAIAICLFQDLLSRADNSLENLINTDIVNHDEKRYLLIMGNISGIQNFIYSIASKGAAKGLKGRSFFIEYIGRLISQRILDEFRLPICCEIYCDGGNFYSLIPACYEIQLEELIKDFKTKLLDIFKGDLFIDIGWIPCNRYNFSIDSLNKDHLTFNKLWAQIHSKVGRIKFQRYNEILLSLNGYNNIFKPQGEGR